MKHKLPVNGKWIEYTDERLAELREQGKLDAVEQIVEREEQYHQNPLSMFLPHGVPWHARPKKYAEGRIALAASEYPKEWGNDGVAFINDWHHDYIMLIAPRKTGKSLQAAAKVGYFMLKCDPRWPVFSETGVKFREWEGPKTAVVASFSWPNVGELWEAYREIWPRAELGRLASDWGKYPGESGVAKSMSFGDGRPKTFEPVLSGGRVIFLCYTQMQHVWENFKADIFHADEQCPLEKLNAYEDGSRTRGDYTPVVTSLSGFKLPERPDTGAAGPWKQIWDGEMKRGSKTVGRYNMDVPSTPDAIITPKKKKELYDLYANPEIERDDKTARRGLAVYYPGWEPGGGLEFDADVCDRAVHVIDPLWEDDKVPRDWTKWRVTDYGDNNISCCAWFAVSPPEWLAKRTGRLGYGGKSIAVCYRVLYERGLKAAEIAREIIDRSHNERVERHREFDDVTGATYTFYEEVLRAEAYWANLLDSRSAAQIKDGASLIELFERYGLSFTAASGRPNYGSQMDGQIVQLKDWMRIDWKLPHPWRKNDEGDGPAMGCPRLFFFDARTHVGTREFDTFSEDPGERRNAADHFIDCCKYWASDGPGWRGGEEKGDDDGRTERGRGGGDGCGRTPYTGY